MSTARSGTDQSTSNHDAYGDSGPSRSTDQSCALSRTGVGTAMWFGTTSATASSPRSWSTSTMRSKAGRPPASAFEPAVVHDVVAVLRARRRGEDRRQVRVRDAERGEMVRDRGHLVEPEAGPHLQPIGRARCRWHPRLLLALGRSRASRSRRTPVVGPPQRRARRWHRLARRGRALTGVPLDPPVPPGRAARAEDGVAGSCVAAAVRDEAASTSSGRRSTIVDRGDATTTSPGA